VTRMMRPWAHARLPEEQGVSRAFMVHTDGQASADMVHTDGALMVHTDGALMVTLMVLSWSH